MSAHPEKEVLQSPTEAIVLREGAGLAALGKLLRKQEEDMRRLAARVAVLERLHGRTNGARGHEQHD